MAERGTYRSIPCALLAGKDFRKLPERPRWMFVVLKLNIGAAGIDTWYADELLARLTSESGAQPEEVTAALDYLEQEGWIEREDNIVWVKGHITHDPHLNPANPKHRKSVQRQLAGLPRLEVVRRFALAHPEWVPIGEAKTMGIEWVTDTKRKGRAIRSRITNTSRSTNKDTDSEKDTPKKHKSAAAAAEPKNSGLDLLPKADCDQLFERWSKHLGAIPYSRFRKAVLTIRSSEAGRQWTTPELGNAIEAYSEWYDEQPDRDQRFLTLEKGFADQVPRWVRLGKMPITHMGEETERGQIVGSKAMRGAA